MTGCATTGCSDNMVLVVVVVVVGEELYRNGELGRFGTCAARC